MVQEAPATTACFAIHLGPSTFGIFDAFRDESGRQAHLSGRVGAALTANASERFAQPPVIEKVGVLTAKLPQEQRVYMALGEFKKALNTFGRP